VAWGIDDIDAGFFPHHGCRFRENGDATFFFKIIGVHHAFGNTLVVAESSGLLEKTINQSCFTMVNVRDNRDITQIHEIRRCCLLKHNMLHASGSLLMR